MSFLYAGWAAVLTCVVDAIEPVTVLHVSGVLDLGGATHIRTALHKTLADQSPAIVVDLAGTVVLEEVTLTVFSAFARLTSVWPGCALLLSVPDLAVREALDRIGVARAVAVYPNRAAALVAANKIPAPRKYRLTLPAVLNATTPARHLVGEACAAWQLPHVVPDAELIVTELVGNAIRHVGGALEVLVTLRDRYLHIAVRDESAARPHRTLPDPDTGEGGRGLLLLDATATSWGTTEVETGKIVWATLRHDRRPTRR